ncbi:MAG: ATP-dependent DNA helicase RecG [Acidobacteria bacterium RIFCSPLOWO2_02_FULL_68_18]|nr:MAG: ATP-dependent DNA helicase RecG [Acidobacteria bacterium RIFCSPLOWO2_02_FULL_68_18]OFW50210.1 MAG: ATP-dependent DNA helicase RecG [Acidobacteria bacterium RIFCSPLOWO2_12_FULL_68_19]
MSVDFLQTPLQFLKGVGPRKAADLKRAGLFTVEDLLYRLPFRYEDRSRMQPIASLGPGAKAAVLGEITSARLSITRRRSFKIFNAVVSDASGAIRCTWMNQAYLADILHPHLQVVIFGDVKLDSTGLHFLNPEYELVTEDITGVHTGRIVPFYEKTGLVTPNMQRKLVRSALDQLPPAIPDILPADLRDRLGLVSRRAAIEASHFPPNDTSLGALNAFRTPAQRRLIFEEFLLFQVGHAWRRHAAGTELKPYVPAVDDRIRAAAAKILPFKLTPGQRQAVKEIVGDMQRRQPMHRLLQGDVGAGKTIVALLAGLVAMENGLQVALMAPTEILAAQHYATTARLLARSRFRVDLLTGSTPGPQKHTLHAHIERGTTNLVVGTHALVQEGIRFHKLGLVIIDEQHRFGVVQRAALRAKGLRPDVLLMTATPIPRTLALTDYSELDVSKITDMPPGRQPVRTLVRPESRRDEVYRLVRDHLDAGRQAYVIYPLVEESEKIDLKSATEMADHLQQEVFPAYRVALLHGRMKPDAKEHVMQAFVAGQIHLLVSTTVVEVGVDVPNASVMLVEHAERFGLSQLHQLRGRVGRGPWESCCILLYQAPWTDEARERLKALAATSDGFAIAERDLELRGPGDFFGTRQSGLPKLRTGDLVRDRDLMEEAHREARRLVADGGLTPDLRQFVDERWEQQFGLIEVG